MSERTQKGARGEYSLFVEDEEVRILFTNRALADAERELGRPAIVVIREFTAKWGRVGDVAALMRAGMEAARKDAREGGKPVSIDQAYDVMDAIGFSNCVVAVVSAASDVLGYKVDDDDEEPDAEAGTQASLRASRSEETDADPN